jgi:N-acetylglutamate synthase-like GNAT family acetyltransferase
MGIEELRLIRGGAIWAARNARPEPVESSLSAAIDNPDVFVTVGEIDGTVVGYSVTHLESLHDESKLAVVDDIYVHPKGRAVSIGESMVDLIIGWASSQGCLGIDSIALPGDRDTKNFFETFGFKARAIIVHRPLSTKELSGAGLDAEEP